MHCSVHGEYVLERRRSVAPGQSGGLASCMLPHRLRACHGGEVMSASAVVHTGGPWPICAGVDCFAAVCCSACAALSVSRTWARTPADGRSQRGPVEVFACCS